MPIKQFCIQEGGENPRLIHDHTSEIELVDGIYRTTRIVQRGRTSGPPIHEDSLNAIQMDASVSSRLTGFSSTSMNSRFRRQKTRLERRQLGTVFRDRPSRNREIKTGSPREPLTQIGVELKGRSPHVPARLRISLLLSPSSSAMSSAKMSTAESKSSESSTLLGADSPSPEPLPVRLMALMTWRTSIGER